MVTKRPAMTYEERLRFNGKVFGLPFIAFVGVGIFALVRGPQRLLLPQALIDGLYPYALLPWEQPFAEGLSLFHQQFVVLALIGALTQAVIGLRAVLPYMPEMKALPNVPRNLIGAVIIVLITIAGRPLFIKAMQGEDPSLLPYIDVNKLIIKLLAPFAFCCTTFLLIAYFMFLVVYIKAYFYRPTCGSEPS